MNIHEFNEIISNNIAVVDFYAEWCSPCKLLSPIFQEIEDLYKDKANFIKINIDNHLDIAKEYQVSSIPTILIFKDGDIVDRMTGFNPLNTIKSRLEKFI